MCKPTEPHLTLIRVKNQWLLHTSGHSTRSHWYLFNHTRATENLQLHLKIQSHVQSKVLKPVLGEAEVNALTFTKSTPTLIGGFLAVALKSVCRGNIFLPIFQIGKLSMKLHSTPEKIHQFTIAKHGNPAPFAITAPASSLHNLSLVRYTTEPVQPTNPAENYPLFPPG